MRKRSMPPEANGYKHFLDNSLEDAMANVRHVAHEQPNIRIHVVLDGFIMSNGKRGEPQELFEDFYKEGMVGKSWITTQHEMNILGESVRLENRSWDSITFWHGGKKVELDMPDFNALRAGG